MAEEAKTTAPPPASEEVVAVPEPPVPEKEQPPVPEAEPEVAEKPAAPEEPEKAEPAKITQSVSYKEETNVAGELPDPQKKALEELKQLVHEALNKHEFTAPPSLPPKEEKAPETAAEEKEEEKKEAEEEKKEEVKEEEKTETTKEAAKPDTEEKPAEASEKVETEAPPPAESKEEEKPAEASHKVETEAPPPAESKEEEKAAHPPAEEVKEVSEKPQAVDDDGTKNVQTIEETVVPAAAPATAAETERPPAPTETDTPAEAGPGEGTSAGPPPPPPPEVFIWGSPLLADERSDVILLKFLRARDFKVREAFAMLKSTILWRKEFGIDALLEEDLGNGWEKFVFMSGVDKEGHPVCYNVYGAFQDKELYQNSFSDEEKRTKFLRWRIQFLEKSIRKLDFSPTGINTIFQVNDLNNSFWPGKKEVRQTTNQALQLLQDNYPEFVAKQVFINVPWWYLAFNRMISPFLTQRTKSKFLFAGPSKTADTLFRYISPEQVPVQYGGLSKEGEQEFTSADSVTEFTIKPTTKHTVEFPVPEKCVVVWEVRVVGWDVNYGAEFVPSAEDGYTVIVSKTRKVVAGDEPVIGESFKAGEPGKVVLIIDNQSSKKKKLLYRYKRKPASD